MIKQLLNYFLALIIIGVIVYFANGLKLDTQMFWQVVGGVALFRTMK